MDSLKEEINALIDKKIEELTGESSEEIESKKIKILKAIYDEGGSVSPERFHELGEEAGYDPRGLGGLFAWKGQGAKLQKIEKVSETEIILTKKGVKYLRRKEVIEEE